MILKHHLFKPWELNRLNNYLGSYFIYKKNIRSIRIFILQFDDCHNECLFLIELKNIEMNYNNINELNMVLVKKKKLFIILVEFCLLFSNTFKLILEWKMLKLKNELWKSSINL